MNGKKERTDAELAKSLRLYNWIGTASGAFVSLLGLGLVFHGFASQRRTLPFFIFGAIIALAGFSFVRFFRRSSTRQQWIQHHCTPVAMRVRLRQDSSGDEWTAEIFEGKDEPAGGAPTYRLPIQPPAGNVSSLNVPASASVYFDPERGHPTLIETEDGMLWGRKPKVVDAPRAIRSRH
ncbi:MAG: hypothetical protein WBQ23_02985 [Bacteroidota bacterium]